MHSNLTDAGRLFVPTPRRVAEKINLAHPYRDIIGRTEKMRNERALGYLLRANSNLLRGHQNAEPIKTQDGLIHGTVRI